MGAAGRPDVSLFFWCFFRVFFFAVIFFDDGVGWGWGGV